MNNSGLIENLKINNINFSDKKIDQLISLMKYTLIANEKFNLTAIKNEEEFLEKMIFDSALPLKYMDLKGKNVIDIGTGAGFPGLVLSILEDEANYTLLDSTSKKIEHIKTFAKNENLHVTGVSFRAEEYARKNIEKFDVAFARAVASLNILLEIITPLLKVGGTFVALKGPNVDEEIKLSKNALKILGLEIVENHNLFLPETNEERNILIIKKVKNTPSKYPREYAAIKKRPL
jgi:16S rRNA (guanine527-N7)-methyltransferase